MHTHMYSDIFRNYSGIFVGPCVNLAYSEAEAYSEPWYMQNNLKHKMKHFTTVVKNYN